MPFEATQPQAETTPRRSTGRTYARARARADGGVRSEREKTNANANARAFDALAVRAQSGDADATAALLEGLLVRLRRLVGHRVLARKNAFGEADVEDALHDVVVHIWQHDLPLFDPARSGFLTFVSRRLDWHIADRARHALRVQGEEVDDEELELVVDEGRDPESLLADAETERTLLRLRVIVDRSETDETARNIIKRHDLEGATLVDVAKELRIHVSNACRARQRGLRHLTRQLGALAA